MFVLRRICFKSCILKSFENSNKKFTNPAEYLQDYIQKILSTEGNESHAAWNRQVLLHGYATMGHKVLLGGIKWEGIKEERGNEVIEKEERGSEREKKINRALKSYEERE